MTTTQSACPFGPGYDFTDPEVLFRGIPVTEFAHLRKTRLVERAAAVGLRRRRLLGQPCC